MSFNDLISLLVLFIFIVLPFVGRLLQGGQRNQPRPGTPARPGVPPTDSRPSARPVVAALPEDEAERPTPASDLERRLEEARRRVREASGQAEARGQRQAPRSQPAPANTPVKEQNPGLSDLFTSPPPPPQQARPSTAFLPNESVTAQPSFKGSVVSKPLEVQRRFGRQRATLRGDRLRGDLVGLSERDFLRGVIWQQILNEPRAKRPYGRGPSQHP